ncbi:MAG TPA: ABC transporter permease [Amnibacterium sp.]|jgi:ABC-2 type transport system permease protein|nr:ABC transporter permease [Amnibacterium sp.]
MTAITLAAADSVTMLRRSLLHQLRYPGLTGFVIGIPVVLLLLFVYVFGGTLGAGLPGGSAHGTDQRYLAYVVPGILLIGVAGIATGAAIGIAKDMTEGIVARFRSMAISRGAVLTGHVLGNTIQGMLCLVAVLAVALLMGFRPTAGLPGWLGLAGVFALICLAISWLSVALGMVAGSVESASNLPMFLTLLPFLGSGFVPTASMPAWLRVFADWQPFTPFIETVRALLFGTDPGLDGWLTLAWCAVIGVGGWLWARALYVRRSVH